MRMVRFSRSLSSMAVLVAACSSQAKLEAHEWGTFTSLVGSNGITQNGMYHEDEVLPAFVHKFGELRNEAVAQKPQPSPRPLPTPRPCQGKICMGDQVLRQNIVTQKMETPVIYFYSDQEQNVEINVRFPEGIVTETYPGPVKTFPTQANLKTTPIIANGDTTFSVKVLTAKVGAVPYVDSRNIYAPARAVDSNLVSSGSELEKFIFYRGIGRFQPKIQITSEQGNLSLLASNVLDIPQALYLVHVDENGHGQMLKLSDLNSGVKQVVPARRIKSLQNHREPSKLNIVSGEQAIGMLADSLIASGLRRDEALAMVNTWERGYLKVPGLRLLYILPRNEVDQVLPLKITPAPSSLVRSFVGRIEILLDTEEQRIMNEVVKQGSAFRIESLGRFAEPILRRVSQVYRETNNESSSKIAGASPEVISLLARLVEKASSTESEVAAVH